MPIRQYKIGVIDARRGDKPEKIGVSLWHNYQNDYWVISFGAPCEYDLGNLFDHSLSRLIENPDEDFCIHSGDELFVPNAVMQDIMFKAAAAAYALSQGGRAV